MTQTIEQLQARVRELEAENAKLHEQVDLQVPKMAFTQLKGQLAAEQLNNKLLRDALQEYIDEHEECQDADDWMAMMCSMEAHHAADKALSQPSDTSALDSFVAEKVKAIEAERDYHMSNAKHVYEQCSKITKQRDLAVEALHYCVKQVPELATVPGIATAIKESEAK